MTLKTRDELLDELNQTVRTAGQGDKTTARDVRTFLTSLIDEMLNRSVDSALAPNLLEALAGTAGAPSEVNKFVTAADPRLIPPAIGSVLEFVFEAGFADAVVRTLGSRQAATYGTEQLQNVGTVTYRLNGSVATLPFVVHSGDSLAVTITRIAAGQGTIVSLESVVALE